MWRLLFAELRDILPSPKPEWSDDQIIMAGIWDSLVSSRWPGTSVADLASFLQENPLSTPDDVVDTVLNDIDEWTWTRKTLKTMKTNVCVQVDVMSVTQQSNADAGGPFNLNGSAHNVSDSIGRRYIGLDLDDHWHDVGVGPTSTTYYPWLGRIFRGIRIGKLRCSSKVANHGSGDLSLHYARWEWYSGHTRRGYPDG